MKIKEDSGKILLRISLSILFLWFAFQQFVNVSAWTGFVPQIVKNIFFNFFGITASQLVYANATLELFLGTFLIIGLYTRVASLILAIHLLGIAAAIGYSPLGMRDFALAMATLSIFFNKADSWCVDKKFD